MNKVFRTLLVLLVASAAAMVVSQDAQAADSMMMVKTHTGVSVTPVGRSSATAYWWVVDGAEKYNVYYGPANNKRQYAVSVPTTRQWEKINYLNPNVTYYYQVVPVIASREVWTKATPVKVLSWGATSSVQAATSVNASPRAYAPTKVGGANVMATTSSPAVMGTTSSSTGTGWSTVSWTNPGGVSKFHVYYWSSTSDMHAVRNLSDKAASITIKALNPGRTYWYRVQAIGFDNKAWWVDQAKQMMVH